MAHSGTARRATARAAINVALVKYWGKRDRAANLPAVGSISLTLDAPGSETTVTFDAALTADVFELDGERRSDARVVQLLDAVRAVAGWKTRASVVSCNSVPTASGLASSASGAAALGLAAWHAAGLTAPLTDPRFLDLVRRGSGSAPRSLLGGLVELDRDSGAVRQLLEPGEWDLRMVIASPTTGPKAVNSRDAMERCRQTSPYYAAWCETHPADLAAAREAISGRDLGALGRVMERSTMKMHACMLAADPPVRYWRAETMALLDAVESQRPRIGWYTMDAGPHVKVLCTSAEVAAVRAAVEPYAREVRVCAPGPGATVEVG